MNLHKSSSNGGKSFTQMYTYPLRLQCMLTSRVTQPNTSLLDTMAEIHKKTKRLLAQKAYLYVGLATFLASWYSVSPEGQ